MLNKVGDFSLVFAGLFLFNIFLTSNSTLINSLHGFIESELINLGGLFCIKLGTFCAFLIILTAITKSAQLHFCMWLPDAMEGPTPVSALIHSSTMVAAGYLLLLKYYVLVQIPSALTLVCFIGLLTNLLSTITLFSTTDIKNTLANSTLAQIAYMFFLFGYGYPILSLMQFSTHAFYKSLLFLSFGGLIHQALNNQDGRLISLLYIQNPITYSCVLIGLLSFVSIPSFIAHYSKVTLLNLTITQNYGIYYGVFLVTEFSQVVNFVAGFGLILILIFNKTNSKLNFQNIRNNHSWELGSSFALFSITVLSLLTLILGPFMLNFSLSTEFLNLTRFTLDNYDVFFNPYNISNWLFLLFFLSTFSFFYFNEEVIYGNNNFSQISGLNN